MIGTATRKRPPGVVGKKSPYDGGHRHDLVHQRPRTGEPPDSPAARNRGTVCRRPSKRQAAPRRQRCGGFLTTSRETQQERIISFAANAARAVGARRRISVAKPRRSPRATPCSAGMRHRRNGCECTRRGARAHEREPNVSLPDSVARVRRAVPGDRYSTRTPASTDAELVIARWKTRQYRPSPRVNLNPHVRWSPLPRPSPSSVRRDTERRVSRSPVATAPLACCSSVRMRSAPTPR